jgi:hypothetical protein
MVQPSKTDMLVMMVPTVVWRVSIAQNQAKVVELDKPIAQDSMFVSTKLVVVNGDKVMNQVGTQTVNHVSHLQGKPAFVNVNAVATVVGLVMVQTTGPSVTADMRTTAVGQRVTNKD